MSLYDVITPAICESGRIKIGTLGELRKSKSGGEYRLPVKLDSFWIATMHRGADGILVPDTQLMDELKKDHADSDGKLRQLPITVLSNDLEEILQSAYVSYIGKRCAARSDGKEITYFCRQGKWLEHPIVEPHTAAAIEVTDQQKRRLFKQHTVFNCIIRSSRSRFGGLYRMRTTSVISAKQLLGSLIQISNLTGGILRGLPLSLVVRPMQVTPDELNGRSTTVYVTQVELIGKDLMQVQKLALERAAFELENRQQIQQTSAKYRQLLALPGVNESPREQEDVAEEFHPDEDNERPAPQTVDPLLASLGIESPEPSVATPVPVQQEADQGGFVPDDEYLADMATWQEQNPPK